MKRLIQKITIGVKDDMGTKAVVTASGKEYILKDNTKINIFNLYKIYKRGKIEVVALKDLELHVNKGEFMMILGPSGCGKTTLMNMIGGIDKPTAGAIFFDEINVSEMDDDEFELYRRDNIGLVFQFFNLIAALNAYENIELPLISKGVIPSERKERVEHLLRLVGLYDRRLHYPSELSGGEQQRIAIASALASRPGILIADEPTGELDSNSAREVMRTFGSLLKDSPSMSIIMVTHDLSLRQYANRIVQMKDGFIEETISNQFECQPETGRQDVEKDQERNVHDFSTTLQQYQYLTDIKACSSCNSPNIQLSIMNSNNVEKPHHLFQLVDVLVVCNSCHNIEKKRIKSFHG